jgi:hypothetical protein
MERGKYGLEYFEAETRADLSCQVLDDTSRAYRPSVIYNTSLPVTISFFKSPIIKLKMPEPHLRVSWPCENARSCAPLAKA